MIGDLGEKLGQAIVVDLHLQLFVETIDQLAVNAAMQRVRRGMGIGFGIAFVIHAGAPSQSSG
jgi:hypothetical protein